MPVQGGRALVRAKVFGFPVHIDLSFLVIMAVLGYFPGVTATWMVLWLVITPLAVLVHELGHAVTARLAGAQPQIALAGFGGVTTFTPPGPLTRARSLGISLAGPFVGLAVGSLLLLVDAIWGGGLEPGGWQISALKIGIWTCMGWSVLNLLPILPLDGGQAFRELLPGTPAVRARRAAIVSVLVAGAAAVAAFLLGQTFLAFFMLFFAANNVLAVRQSSASAAARRQNAPATPEQAVVALLWQGQSAQARQVLETAPPETSVDLAVHGAVLALTGDPQQGHALLAQEVARRPTDPNPAALLVLTYTLEHDWDAVVGVLQGPGRPYVPSAVVERAVAEARGVGREDVAGRLTLLAQPPA